MKLPFKHGKIIESSFFVNREKEITYLQHNFESKINTIVISPRRWGKSSLVMKASKDLARRNKTIRYVYIDMFNVRTEQEFYQVFTEELLKVSYAKWEERIKKAKDFFKQVIPKFSFGVDPQNEFSVSFDWEEVEKNPSEILNLPETLSKAKKIEIVVCLDEFQNISHFKNHLEFQKKLRAHWQHHQIATYCLYGSKRHMMTELFESKSMPFYKFGDVLFLKKIETDHWVKYITKQFKKTEKEISVRLAEKITITVENHSYFVQQLSNVVWRNTKIHCTNKNVNDAIEELTEQYDLLFHKEIDSLSNPQINYLKAMVNKVEGMSSGKVIKRYNLGSSANVSIIKKALIKKEIIDAYGRSIEFLDPLFKLWFERVYMR